MKKHLIAAAVAAAVAVPAMAQVTIGGNFDVSYDLGKQNETQNLNTQGAMSTSALTLAGKEDLGGGMYAAFNINSRLGQGGNIEGRAGSGQVEPDDADTGERQGAINFGDRGFQVGIGGAFGEIMIGKTTATAIGGTIRGGVAGNFSLLTESLWGDRPNDMISYTSPELTKGLKVRGVYQLESKSYELSANYKAGAITIDAAYNNVEAGANQGLNGATSSTQGSFATIAGNDMGARVQYNAGVALINVSYLKNESGNAAKPNQYSVGLSIPLGATSVIAEYGDRDLPGANNTGGAFYNVGAIHSMSKRTNVYGIYAKVDSATAAATGVQGVNGVAEEARIVLGLRHSF